MTHVRTAGGAKTLPARLYTSPAIFRLEMDRIFATRWLYAARASELDAPGRWIALSVGRDSLLVLKDADRVRAFHNVCRHRGTRLCAEPAGRFDGPIRCPYHAWSYALDGRLIGAPNMQDVEGFDKADYPLHAVPVASWDGGLFVSMNPRAPAFEEAFAPLRGRCDAWRLAELVPAHRITYDVNANWKLIFQNYSECYHCPSLHPLLNRLTPFRDASNDLTEGPILGGPMRLSREHGSMTMSGARCAAPLAGVKGEDLSRVYYYTIFPNMLLSLHPDYVLIHRISPLACDRTQIVCEWLFHPEAAGGAGFDPSDAVTFWNTTNAQDWGISERSQQGIASRAYVPGPYAALESMVAAWDRNYLAALGGVPEED